MDGRSADLSAVLFGLVSVAIRGRQRGLSLTVVSTLATLDRTGPQRLTDLAACEGVTQPSMTAVVSQLEQLGLAERRRDPRDGRVVRVAISGAGSRHLRSMRAASAAGFTAMIDRLPEPEVAQLAAALPALRHLLELAEDGGPPSAARPRAGRRPAQHDTDEVIA
jgi:DNA-binding MarR family transcriptional regulator